MQLHIDGIADNQPIPERFAFGVQDDDAHVRLGENRNPAVSWSGLPDGTQSLVLICVDTDVPTRPDDVNDPDLSNNSAVDTTTINAAPPPSGSACYAVAGSNGGTDADRLVQIQISDGSETNIGLLGTTDVEAIA